MRNILSISINDELLDKLKAFSRMEKTSRSDIVKRALYQYFYTKEMENIRTEIGPYAEKKGFYSDDDILNSRS